MPIASLAGQRGPSSWLAEAGRGWPKLADTVGSLRRALALEEESPLAAGCASLCPPLRQEFSENSIYAAICLTP